MAIVRNLKDRNSYNLINELNSIYLADFNKIYGKKGEQELQKRLKWKKTDSDERFLTERLVTIHEIDYAVKKEAKSCGENIAKCLYADEKYEGRNDNIKKMLRIRAQLNKSEMKRKINEMIDKIKEPLFNKLLDDLKLGQDVEVN